MAVTLMASAQSFETAAEAVSSLNRFTSSKARMSAKESKFTTGELLMMELSLTLRMTAACRSSLYAESAT